MTELEKLKELTHLNGKLNGSKCRESNIQKNGLHDFVMSAPIDFISFSDKISYLIHGGGYCDGCGKRTKRNTSGNGFTQYCGTPCYRKMNQDHAPGRKELDDQEIRRMYIDELMTPMQIGKLLGCSNVTINKRIEKLDIKRSHAEQQSIHSGCKGKSAWNSGQFDKSKVYDIEFIKHENKTSSLINIAEREGCSPSLLYQVSKANGYKPIKLFSSTQERIIHDILDKHHISYMKRNVVNGVELDILIPSANIAIEVDGVYWHSETMGKDVNYHINKTKHSSNNGIFLFHFWDFEISEKPDIVESMILAKMGLTNKIFARKCEVREVDNKTAKLFLEENHLQGYAACKFNIGLYYNDTLVMLSTFSKPRFSKDADLELVRLCTLKGFTVIGGMSKLLSRVDGSILSYANKRYSVGDAYSKAGFKFLRDSKPGFFYYYPRTKTRVSRYMDVRSLGEVLNNGATRVWDCGNSVWILDNKKALN